MNIKLYNSVFIVTVFCFLGSSPAWANSSLISSVVISTGTAVVERQFSNRLSSNDNYLNQCSKSVQNKIPRNNMGEKKWTQTNLKRLCTGAENSIEPGLCFNQVMNEDTKRGPESLWTSQQASNLCNGSLDHINTMNCFSKKVLTGNSKSHAIKLCSRK